MDSWREQYTVVIYSESISQMRSAMASIISGQSGSVDFVVVTNNEICAEECKALDIPQVKYEGNYSKSMNAAIETIKTKYLIFFSEGARLLTPFGLSELVRTHETLEEVGLLMPSMTGDLQGKSIYRSGATWEFANIRPVDFFIVVGLIRKDLHEKIGRFDEQFLGKLHSDVDYAIRLMEAGYKINVYQQVVINNALMRIRSHEGDSERMTKKHRATMIKYGIR